VSPADGQSGNPVVGPFSCTMKRSAAVTRPVLSKPILSRPWKPVRALPKKYSSARLIRIITGLPIFFDMCAGTDMIG
jgi:hypothetical protein